MVAEIGAELDRIEHDKTVRVVIFGGTGRAFCAGADLSEALTLAENDDAEAATLAFVDGIAALVSRVERLQRPTIAAVNGLAIAGGLELVLACDLVVASKSARLGDGHAKYGLLPGAGGSARLPRKVGPTRAKYLMFTAEYLSADELAAWGLINQVVPDDELDEAANRLAKTIAAKSPLALTRMKTLVDGALDQPLPSALAAERTMSALHVYSRDRAEGLAAFAAKRQPRFTGN
jgi:enoyl-CoA hydratase/carnithine racemase